VYDETETTESAKEYSKVKGISIMQRKGRWRVTINGEVYEGTGDPQITTHNNVLYVDGIPHDQVKPLGKDNILRLEVQMLGSVKGLSTTGDVTVHGDVQGDVDTQGRVEVAQGVGGSVNSMGRVEVGGDVGSRVDSQGRVAVTGNVSGSINTMGKVEVQGSVGGKIDTMGKVIVHNRK
jgi:hypothetical protein